MLYQKVYNLTMDNGREVVAKVPLPHESMPHLTCASQVASMDFLPAPTVLAWNSHSRVQDNPVGAEYVLVDKFPGVALESVWDDLSPASVHKLMEQLAGYQDNLLSRTFRQIGAIYYADQAGPTSTGPLVYTDGDGKEIQDTRFTVGPVINLNWVKSDRRKLECDRGPWNSTMDFLHAIVYRELEAVEKAEQVPVSASFEILLGRVGYRPTKAKKRRVGEWYLKVLRHMAPLGSPIDRFRFWHNRVGMDTIFVDARDNSKIVGLTGWDHSQVAPMFKQAVWPKLSDWAAGMDEVDGDDDEELVVRSEEGTGARNFERLCRNHSASKKLLLLQQSSEPLEAKRFQQCKFGSRIRWAEEIFDDAEAYSAWAFWQLRKRWRKYMPHVPRRKAAYPIKISRRLERNLCRDLQRWRDGADLMDMVSSRLDRMPIYDHAPVCAEDYKKTARKLRKLKKEFVAKGLVYEDTWPFDA
ncbi:hypothetical protein SLS58_010645 [Diplodia intermedia]|uniref:Aminoglycoside phosphotransferase domain-containing protein n=1 Tax=Diplodia intermedia TaxID=856260 RepID=A0ABR3T585_9PEZI